MKVCSKWDKGRSQSLKLHLCKKVNLCRFSAILLLHWVKNAVLVLIWNVTADMKIVTTVRQKTLSARTRPLKVLHVPSYRNILSESKGPNSKCSRKDLYKATAHQGSQLCSFENPCWAWYPWCPSTNASIIFVGNALGCVWPFTMISSELNGLMPDLTSPVTTPRV